MERQTRVLVEELRQMPIRACQILSIRACPDKLGFQIPQVRVKVSLGKSGYLILLLKASLVKAIQV